MNRRQFLSSSAAGLALAHAAPSAEFADRKPPRVGLIGCGWYGKVDLLRLIQVAPVEVVSLCDVDKKMLADAAEVVAGRQASKKKPRTYGDYRDMLKEKDLDIVLVDTPDHWHALPMIAAVESGTDVWVQKPISVDVAEGQAMVAAAQSTSASCRSAPSGAVRRISSTHATGSSRRANSARSPTLKFTATTTCARENPPDTAPPTNLDYEMWTGPAPMRPYNKLVHPRSWRAFMRYGNGIMGDMCIHMLDMVRWMLDLGWPKRIASSGGILVDKKSKADITDTQGATFDFDDLQVVWQHRTWGAANDPQYPWGATIYGDKGTLKVDVYKYAFTPFGADKPTLTGKAVYEYDKYPEDKDEKELEQHVASAVRVHMRDFLRAIASRGKPVADIEQGHISTASCILANRRWS